MTYKVVRNAGGVVCAGPNDDNYDPTIKSGEALSIEDNLPPPTLPSLTAAALAQVRSLRAALFPVLAGLQSEALARGNAADAMAIATMQQGCRDITATDLTGATTKAEIELKFKKAWDALLLAAPLSVVNAFKGLSK